MDEKTCPRCRTTKPREDFHARGRSGLSGYCKACMSDYYRIRYMAKHPTPKRARVISLWCKDCQRELEHSAFYWDKRGYRSSYCKTCKNARDKARLAANPEYDRDASRRHYQRRKAQRIAERLARSGG